MVCCSCWEEEDIEFEMDIVLPVDYTGFAEGSFSLDTGLVVVDSCFEEGGSILGVVDFAADSVFQKAMECCAVLQDLRLWLSPYSTGIGSLASCY